MNRIIRENCKTLRKIAFSAFKNRMFEAILVALCCQLLVQAPSIIFGFLPIKMQTQFVANLVNFYSLAVNGPATLGMCHYFALAFRGEASQGVAELKFGFNNIWKALFLYIRIRVFTWFWSLFFVIPGIIASINYSQSFFILNEDPNRSAAGCMYESKFVMNGNKLKYVSLILSYLPIYIITAAPAAIAHIILDKASIEAMQSLIVQGDMQNAVMYASDVSPYVSLLMLLTVIATAFVTPAQVTFFDLLAGKLVIQQYDDYNSRAASSEAFSPVRPVVGEEDNINPINNEPTIVDVDYTEVVEEAEVPEEPTVVDVEYKENNNDNE